MEMHAKPQRSIAKSVTWRITATLTTILLVWIATGRIDIAIGIGAAEFIIKIAIYYGHERVWARIRWGLIQYDK